MAVHIYEEKLKISAAAFEARYEDGYTYLDFCGETIVAIRRQDRRWAIATPFDNMPNGTTMVNQDLALSLGFGSENFNVAIRKRFPALNGEKEAEKLGIQAEALYELVVRRIRVPETSRVGVRYTFVAPADSLEEADRFVSRGAKSPMLDVIMNVSRSNLRDASLSFVVEDEVTGHRRRVTIESQAVLKASDPAFTGLESTGEAVISIDIDTFTRPDNGHFQRTNLFIQNSYIRSRAIAMELFQWLDKQNRSKRHDDSV